MYEENAKNQDSQTAALQIAQILKDGKGENVVVIDVSKISSWTDFFVIATVKSRAHWQGLERQIKDYIKENGMRVHHANHKIQGGDDWNLIDADSVVVHLMSQDARDFYELEKLWHAGIVINEATDSSKQNTTNI